MAPRTFGPSAANENERRKEVAILGHLLPVIIAGAETGAAPTLAPASTETIGLIDTGASDICIDYRLAISLGLREIDQRNVGVVGGSVMAKIYLGRLIVPDVGFDRMCPLYALKVRHPTHEVLLGRSFLENYIVTFDGPAGMFTFAGREDFHPRSAIEDDFAT